MKTFTSLSLALFIVAALAGCGQSKTDAPDIETSAMSPASTTPTDAKGQFSETGGQTTLAPIAMEPFTVDSLHIGELAKGHFNLYIKGGEPAIVRAWIGDEAATDAFIAKAEFEVDHHCAHIEVPDPLPAGAKLWVEIETTDGARVKGSTEIH